jgi:hypothetical protein
MSSDFNGLNADESVEILSDISNEVSRSYGNPCPHKYTESIRYQ